MANKGALSTLSTEKIKQLRQVKPNIFCQQRKKHAHQFVRSVPQSTVVGFPLCNF